MSNLVDKYREVNQDNYGVVSEGSAWAQKIGQSFTSSQNGLILKSCIFYLAKVGAPTGTAVATLYAHSGTFGVSSVPTGAALATSDTLDVTTLTTSFVLTTFNFSGANRVALTGTTNYVIAIEYSTGDVSNYVKVGIDQSSPTHSGNYSDFFTSWAASSLLDVCFYVYIIQSGVLSNLKAIRPRAFAPGNAR